MRKIVTRESRKLLGDVRLVESEFAVFEEQNGETVEAHQQREYFERYDTAGRLVEEVSGERMLIDQVYRDVYIYSEKGDLFEWQEFDEDGTLTGKFVFEKATDGSEIQKNFYVGDDDQLILYCIIRYDDEGEIVDISDFDRDGNLRPEREKYPMTERLTTNIDEFTVEERSFNLNGSLSQTIVRTYDTKGNEKEFSVFEPDGKLSIKEEYEYEFDEKGNWTEMTSFRWVVGWGEFQLYPQSVTRRRITYY